jgi:hypothetical protein
MKNKNEIPAEHLALLRDAHIHQRQTLEEALDIVEHAMLQAELHDPYDLPRLCRKQSCLQERLDSLLALVPRREVAPDTAPPQSTKTTAEESRRAEGPTFWSGKEAAASLGVRPVRLYELCAVSEKNSLEDIPFIVTGKGSKRTHRRFFADPERLQRWWNEAHNISRNVGVCKH